MYKLKVERMPDERWARKVYSNVIQESKILQEFSKKSFREVNLGRDQVAGWNVVYGNGERCHWDKRRWKKVVVQKVHALG